MWLRGMLIGLLLVSFELYALEYVGSDSCKGCHQTELKNWQQSHHAKAMQPANENTVLGNFDHFRFESGDSWTLFNKDEKGYYIETGSLGKPGRRYSVPYVFAYQPLQQILVDIGKGRLQAYTIAWDSRLNTKGGQRWYNLYEQSHTPDTPFYWKGQFNNWNARCAECHSTNLIRDYQPASDSYKTRWSEVNVSCEACHGPASKHLELIRTNQTGKSSGFETLLHKRSNWVFKENLPTAVRFGEGKISIDHGQPDQCASCHSRRIALTDGAGAGDFAQHHIPRLAEPDLYHADGQILDEVYVYGSFSQSKMAAAGVVCSNCHEPHTGKVLAQDNNLCAQCHKPTTFDRPEHTLHQMGTEGSACVDCHMPTKRYMGVDDRRDHAFRVPNPWVSEVLGSPDVCLGCHQDKDAKWSQALLTPRKDKIFSDHSDIGPALVLNQQDSDQGQALLRRLVVDENQPPMRRAVLLRHLTLSDAKNGEAINIAANSPESLVKLGVIRTLEQAPFPLQLQIGFGLLYDDDKNVRMQAIKLLAPAFRRNVPEKAQKPLQDALIEAVSTYQKQQDLLSAQLGLADMAYKVGDPEQAKVHYGNANRLQPSFLPAKLNLASIYRETGELSKAKTLLDEILSIETNHAMAQHNLGLIYVVQRQWPLALTALAKAAELEPDNTRFGFVYLLGLEGSGDIQGALTQLKKLEQLTPDDPALVEMRKRLKQAK